VHTEGAKLYDSLLLLNLTLLKITARLKRFLTYFVSVIECSGVCLPCFSLVTFMSFQTWADSNHFRHNATHQQFIRSCKLLKASVQFVKVSVL
jgi:hypothetical protein